MNVQLPQNITLLSDQELEDLIHNHKPELSQYVKQSHTNSIETISQQTQTKKQQLLNLWESYTQLEQRRLEVNKETDLVKSLYTEYSNKWQNLERLYKEQYSEEAFKNQLNSNVILQDTETNVLKAQILSLTDMDQLDSLLEKYRDKRTQYHYLKEQLTTWEEQGSLRM